VELKTSVPRFGPDCKAGLQAFPHQAESR
jgi:hypothetical protein